MQKSIIAGNLGGDPELRYTAKGTALISFNVAVSTRVKPSADEDWQEHTEWFRVKTSRNADSLQKRLGKGTRVLVVGDLQIGTYQSRDGDTRYSLDIWADSVEIQARGLTQNGETGDSEPVAASTPRTQQGSGGQRSASKQQPPTESSELDDLPFNLPRHIQEPWLDWRCP